MALSLPRAGPERPSFSVSCTSLLHDELSLRFLTFYSNGFTADTSLPRKAVAAAAHISFSLAEFLIMAFDWQTNKTLREKRETSSWRHDRSLSSPSPCPFLHSFCFLSFPSLLFGVDAANGWAWDQAHDRTSKTVGTNGRVQDWSFERAFLSFRFSFFFSVSRSSCTGRAGLDTVVVVVVVVVVLLSSPFLLFSYEAFLCFGGKRIHLSAPDLSRLRISSSLPPQHSDPCFSADAPLRTPTLLSVFPQLIRLTSCRLPLSVGIPCSFCHQRNLLFLMPLRYPHMSQYTVLGLFQTSLASFWFCPNFLFRSPSLNISPSITRYRMPLSDRIFFAAA